MTRFPGLSVFGVLLVVWFIADSLHVVGPTLLAGPGEVWTALWQSSRSGEHGLFSHLTGTLQRALEGWAIGVVSGAAVGVAFGSKPTLYRAAEPVLEFTRAIPPIMIFPLLLVAFNFGEGAYVWTIFFGSVPVMSLAVARGVQRVSPIRTEILDVFDVAGPLRLLVRGVEILPSCFLGARLAFSISLIVAVVTEMVFAPRSGRALGAFAKDAEISFDTPVFFAALVVIGVFGYLTNLGMRKAEERLGGGESGLAR